MESYVKASRVARHDLLQLSVTLASQQTRHLRRCEFFDFRGSQSNSHLILRACEPFDFAGFLSPHPEERPHKRVYARLRRAMAAVSKDGGKLGVRGHGSRRPLRGLLRMRPSFYRRSSDASL